MIQVIIPADDGAVSHVDFETNAVEVIDGALVVYTYGAKDFIAGFAPGQWLTFQRMDL